MSYSAIPTDILPYILGEKTDYSTHQRSILTINIIFSSLVVSTTALRFWVRFRMLRAVGLDDILMVVALLFALILSAACLVARYYGLGLHIWNLSAVLTDIPVHTARVTKCLYCCYLAYAMAIAFVKFSIIATYFRIFAAGILRKTVMAVGFVVLALLLCNIFAVIFTCIPVQAAWDYTIKGKCFPIDRFFYASSGINIATDLALCFLPIPTLWKLSMPRSQRIVLCLLFALGAFTCVASVFRLTTLQSTAVANISDFSYNVVNSLNWSVIEVGTGIMCTSLASLRPLATRLLPQFFSQFSMPNSRYAEHTERGTKFSVLSRTRGHTINSKTEGSMHETHDEGVIHVQRSFDVWNEVDDGPKDKLDDTAERSDSKISVRHNSVYTQTQEVFDNRSSEEELVQAKKVYIPRR